jgi:hypothetical protein
MKLLGWFAIGLLLFATGLLLFAAAAPAAEPKPLPNHEQARKTCHAEAAKAPVKHPADIVKVQREAFDSCMRAKGVHTRVIRAK